MTRQQARIRRPDPEPLEADDVKIVAVGTVVWFALFLVSLPFRGTLADDGHEWWSWCALAGAGLGILGLWYVRRRHAALDRRDAERYAAEYAARHPDAPRDDPDMPRD
ncbi:hypothetical protein GCM10023205_41390 [Yinghuangia aomiensis]|uniref:DUF2530 domain-containing protein n=1 Tax=Yinghuangia aomiensis TaxID=676205 RepID=A0ABP9HIC3_9ACTN